MHKHAPEMDDAFKVMRAYTHAHAHTHRLVLLSGAERGSQAAVRVCLGVHLRVYGSATNTHTQAHTHTCTE